MTIFKGLTEWSDNFPQVAFCTPHGMFDLHNDAHVVGLSILPGHSVLRLDFKYAQDWERIEEEGIIVSLRFGEIENLKIEQAEDFDPRAAISLEGIFHDTNEAINRFELDLGDIAGSLDAGTLELIIGKEYSLNGPL